MIKTFFTSLFKQKIIISTQHLKTFKYNSPTYIFSTSNRIINNLTQLEINKHNCIQYKNFLTFSTSKNDKISILQSQAAVVKLAKGQNSMQYIQKLHQLSFANAQQKNHQKAIQLYEEVVKRFRQSISDTQDPAMGDTLKNLQILYRRGGKLMEFIPLTIELIKIRTKQLGKQHKTIANEYNQLGVAYYHIGNLEEALNNYQNALKIRQKIFGQSAVEVLELKNNIAKTYYSQGEFPKAKQIFEANISKIKSLPNFNQKLIITPITNLAAILQNQGKYQQALQKYKQIIQILTRIQSKPSYFLANIYHSMGIVYGKMNNMNQAEKSYTKSLQINLQIYSDNHPNVAQNYHNLAVCYQAKGDLQKSLHSYNKAVEIKKKTLGEKHPSLAETYSNMGILFKLMGKNTQAKQKYQEALNILKQVNPDQNSNPIYGDMYLNIGSIFLEQQNSQKASEMLEKAYSIYKNFFDETHPKFSDLYFNKAKVQFLFTRDYSKALQYLNKSIQSDEKYSVTNPNSYLKYSMKGSCLFELKRFQQAIKQYNKSHEILAKTVKAGSQQILANSALLNYQVGASYLELKEYLKAKQNLLQATQAFEKNFGQAHQTLVELYFMLGNIQKALDNKDISQVYYKKADQSIDKILKQIPNHPLLLKKQQQIKKCLN